MNLNGNKILKLGNPLTKTLLYDAYPLEVITAQGNEYLEWFLSTYIQLCIRDLSDYDEDLFMSFYGSYALESPFIKMQKISKKVLIASGQDLHEFIKNQIDHGYYVYCLVDDYYIPNRFVTGKWHFIHDEMVFGYDDNLEVYNILGYGVNGKYAQDTCTYKEFNNAFKSYNKETDQEYYDYIRMFTYQPAEYKFNLKLAKLLLEDYVEGKTTLAEYSPVSRTQICTIFGIDIYKKVRDYLHWIDENKKNIDMRVFRIIMEHKKIMILRLKYFDENICGMKDLISLYKTIEEQATTMFNVAIKYTITFNNKLLKKLENTLLEIETNERTILKQVIQRIS